MTITTTSTTTAGDYTLTILGVSGSLSHSLSIPFIVESSQENIIVENYVFHSGGNITLDLRNVSTAPVSLVSYNVTDHFAAVTGGPLRQIVSPSSTWLILQPLIPDLSYRPNLSSISISE